VGPVNIDEWYFDVSNIAYYDAIVGMPFCQKHQVKIDIGSRTIEVAGQLIEIAGVTINRLDRYLLRTVHLGLLLDS
jgi:hypothetical protein